MTHPMAQVSTPTFQSLLSPTPYQWQQRGRRRGWGRGGGMWPCFEKNFKSSPFPKLVVLSATIFPFRNEQGFLLVPTVLLRDLRKFCAMCHLLNAFIPNLCLPPPPKINLPFPCFYTLPSLGFAYFKPCIFQNKEPHRSSRKERLRWDLLGRQIRNSAPNRWEFMTIESNVSGNEKNGEL